MARCENAGRNEAVCAVCPKMYCNSHPFYIARLDYRVREEEGEFLPDYLSGKEDEAAAKAAVVAARDAVLAVHGKPAGWFDNWSEL